MQLSVMLFLHC